MNVLFSHAYSMSHVRVLCERGEYPRQHLWGADALERAGHRVEWGPFGGSPALARVTRATRGKLGDLEQEVAMARAADGRTLCYSGDQNLMRGLAYLRRGRLPGPRMAAVFHSIGDPSPASSWVRGVDVALCLSERTRDTLVERYGRDPARTVAVRWGPDLAFPGYAAGGEEFVVSAGKTGRDIPTLMEALRRTGLPSRVYALKRGEPPRDLGEVLADIGRASVVAIPLEDPQRLLGLSELNDALAMGKPVVMTRSPHFDFDIEEEGFGVWVEPGDAAGLARALARVAGDPAEAAAMGRRGRAFAERHWNYELFCERVRAVLEEHCGAAA